MKYFMTIALLTLSIYSHANEGSHLLCDQNNTYAVLVGEGVFQVTTYSKVELRNDWGLTYSTYGKDSFVSITFADDKMESGILSMGGYLPYQGIDRDSVVQADLTKSYCK